MVLRMWSLSDRTTGSFWQNFCWTVEENLISLNQLEKMKWMYIINQNFVATTDHSTLSVYDIFRSRIIFASFKLNAEMSAIVWWMANWKSWRTVLRLKRSFIVVGNLNLEEPTLLTTIIFYLSFNKYCNITMCGEYR